MPLPGGDADKVGNRYESRWTVHSMAEVMAETASSIWLEPAGDGAEFVLFRDGRREYH